MEAEVSAEVGAKTEPGRGEDGAKWGKSGQQG